MKVLFISLGCDKNLVDTEFMLGMLAESGYEFTDVEEEADIIIVNSCCFIRDAKEESIETILEMAKWKEEGKCKALIVTGCLAQRYQNEILTEIPEVDALLGTNSYDEIAAALERTLKGDCVKVFHTLTSLPSQKTKRILSTPGHFAHLKIAEGCNKNCTYCIIPQIRGPYRSVPIEELVEQARTLVEGGVKELILVAQETTLYGMDLYGEKSLYKLLDQLNKLEGLVWIRILYCYPEEIDDTLIASILRNEKVCHYLDMPIQHSSDKILKSMGRRTTHNELVEKIQTLREKIPDICIRTTLISGFPGETEEEHQELLRFIQDMKFERLGVFNYSPEEDTPSIQFPNQVPEEQSELWRGELMELSETMIAQKNESLIGETYLVMIEGKVQEEHSYVARTYRDAPDIDGYLFITTEEELMTGDFVRVNVTGAYEYDLIGEIV
ncbi:MAG: 30S ribosomal protein S12 methylthiotransferase RimO [Lachnospiraceae bacterium]